jgi:hypothetical protein
MKTILILLLSFTTYAQPTVDKYAHLGVGYIINTSTLLYLKSKNIKTGKAVLISLGTTVLAGVGKEVYDLRVKKTFFDANDVVWTYWGGILSSFTYTINIEWNKEKIKL